MSARLSQEITECVRSGRYLLSAFETEGPRVAAHFLDSTRPHLEEGDADPGADGFLVAVERSLRAALNRLTLADFAVAKAAGFESELRHRLQDDKRQLAFFIVALRRLVLAQYVRPDMENLGLQPMNVRDTMTVLRRAELAGQRFEAVTLLDLLGESRFAKPVDLSPHVAEIRVKAAELAALSEELDEAHRATDRARIERNRAKDNYDRIYLRGARMFEDLCRFSGLDGLADRVRRRKNRPAVVEKAVAVEPAEEPVAEEPGADITPDEMPIGDTSSGDTIAQHNILQEENRDDDGSVALEVVDLGVADLQATHVQADAEVPGVAHGGLSRGPAQPKPTQTEVLSPVLRPLRVGRPRVRPERAGAAEAGAGAGDSRGEFQRR